MDDNKLVKSLIIIVGILIILNIINQLIGEASWQFNRLIHLGFESNFSTWFSSMLWAIAAYAAYRCGVLSKAKNLPYKIWNWTALFLLFLSCDEVAMMHENFGTFVNKHSFNFNLNTSWPILFAPIIIPIMLYIGISLYKCLSDSKEALRMILLGFALFIIGSMVLEQSTILSFYQGSTFFKMTETILEESFEMFGAIFIIKGLFIHRGILEQKWIL